MRAAAIRALLEGGNYHEALVTEGVLAALEDISEIPITVPIRFRKRYEDMKEEHDRSDPDPEGH